MGLPCPQTAHPVIHETSWNSCALNPSDRKISLATKALHVHRWWQHVAIPRQSSLLAAAFPLKLLKFALISSARSVAPPHRCFPTTLHLSLAATSSIPVTSRSFRSHSSLLTLDELSFLTSLSALNLKHWLSTSTSVLYAMLCTHMAPR